MWTEPNTTAIQFISVNIVKLLSGDLSRAMFLSLD